MGLGQTCQPCRRRTPGRHATSPRLGPAKRWIRLVEQRGQHTDVVRRVLRPARNSDVDLRRPRDGRRGTGTGEAALQDAGGSAPAPNRRASSAAGEPRSASDPAASARIRWVSAHNCSSISVVMLCGSPFQHHLQLTRLGVRAQQPGGQYEHGQPDFHPDRPRRPRCGLGVSATRRFACPGASQGPPPVASRQDAPGLWSLPHRGRSAFGALTS